VRSEPFDVRLARARLIAPSVRELVFERVDERPFDYAPGQWVNLLLPIGPELMKRAYSIASAPGKGSRFEIAVTKVTGGPGSEYLHAMTEGTVLHAVGPHGLFTRPEEDPPSLFVATGTGVAPFRSMIRAALDKGSRAPLWLLLGARFEEDILYRAEFEAVAKEHPGARFEVTLSRGSEAWIGRRGYVQHHVGHLYEELRGIAASSPHVFICGLDRMVGAVKELVREELQVDRKKVHVERYD
jgi:ferredoxin-NADP reductase